MLDVDPVGKRMPDVIHLIANGDDLGCDTSIFHGIADFQGIVVYLPGQTVDITWPS